MQIYDPECYQDFDCWYQTFQLHVEWACEDSVQVRSQGKYIWMGSLHTEKFDAKSWGDFEKKTVKISGNQVSVLVENGEYVRKGYTCIYDRDADSVVQVSMH